MKKYFLPILMLCITPSLMYAQDWLGFHSSNYTGIYGISNQPASIVDSRYKFQMNIIGASAYVSNNYYSLPNADVKKFDFDFDRLIESDKGSDKGGKVVSDIYAPLSFMLTLSPKHALGLSVRQRTLTNVDGINSDAADFLNKIFDQEEFVIDENESYDLSNIYAQTHEWNEVGLTYGRVVFDHETSFLKAAGTLKLLDGISSGYAYLNQLSYAGDANDLVDVLAIDIQSGLSDNISYEDDFTYKTFENTGVGLDLGVVYEWRPHIDRYRYDMDGKEGLLRRDKNKYKLRLGLSLLDLGSIKYTKSQDSGNIFGSTEDLDVNNLNGDIDEILESIFTYERGGSYKMNLPTRFLLDADYKVSGGFYTNFTSQIALKGGESDKEKTRYISTVSLTPRWESRAFEIGVPLSYDKLANANAGIYFRLACLIVGSRDIVSNYLLGKDATSAHAYFGLQLNIPYKKKKDRDRDGVSNKRDECPKTPGVWAFKGCPDTDGDGVQDKDDLCPDVAGSEALQGCPDTDGDGIKDVDDTCPNEAGEARFNGCPDSDNDGVEDSKDECVSQPGSPELSGCPDLDGDGVKDNEDLCPKTAGDKEHAGCPDTDGDGLYDNEDKCKEEAGKRENYGCPEPVEEVVEEDNVPAVETTEEPYLEEIEQAVAAESEVVLAEEQEVVNTAFANLEFKSGSTKMAMSSYNSMVELAVLLKNRPNWKLRIAGHTDNVGNPDNNLKLSKERAQVVAEFLSYQGVAKDRLIVEGYGDKEPVAGNDTPEGRKQNRRVELEIIIE
ncbi:DUF5723 family protein [Fulvivirga ligni]|uniref:DUF5723 family protein n=1 Tax=Fulvivirga ligni TaxID=2904246 RepID=UPI001F3900E3|nr:DUF5723 family protein [Fulvivirga ligni]UII21319.1 DUF5723 family protein [Fulvivirga ligni]